VVDVWLLLVVHALPAYKKPVEKLFRAKILDGGFTVPLLASAVDGHSSALKEYFPCLLALTEQLTRAGGAKQQLCGSCLYAGIFREFRDVASQHEVIHALHTHIGSGVQVEAGAALDALLDLARDEESRTMLSQSQGHLKPLLDYTSGFGDEQIRKVFTLFAKLGLVNDLVIIIRKQLSNTELQ
jgi:Fanconi anemia group D2 protein